MTIYGVVLCLPLLWFIVSNRTCLSRSLESFMLKFSLFVLFLISSLRKSNMGADYENYIAIFREVMFYGDTYLREKGYVVYMKLLSLISNEYYIVAIGVNFLFFLSLYIFIHKFIHYKYYSFCILLFVANPYMYIQSTFNIIRQTSAISFVMLALVMYFSKENYKIRLSLFLVGVLIASAFHLTALIMLLLPAFEKITIKTGTWLVIAAFFLFVNLSGVYKLLENIILNIGYIKIIDRKEVPLNNILYIAVLSVYYIWIVYQSKRIYKNGCLLNYEKLFMNLYIFTLAFLFFALSNDLIYRFRVFFLIISLPALPILFNSKSNNNVTDSIKIKFTSIAKITYLIYNVTFYIAYILYLDYIYDSAYIPFLFLWD